MGMNLDVQVFAGFTVAALSLPSSPQTMTHLSFRVHSSLQLFKKSPAEPWLAWPASLPEWVISQGGTGGKPMLLPETGPTTKEEEERNTLGMVSSGPSQEGWWKGMSSTRGAMYTNRHKHLN